MVIYYHTSTKSAKQIVKRTNKHRNFLTENRVRRTVSTPHNSTMMPSPILSKPVEILLATFQKKDTYSPKMGKFRKFERIYVENKQIDFFKSQYSLANGANIIETMLKLQASRRAAACSLAGVVCQALKRCNEDFGTLSQRVSKT